MVDAGPSRLTTPFDEQMRKRYGIEAVEARDRGSHAAIGNFDGLHRGHRAVIAAARQAAANSGGPLSAITFEPHPRHYFGRNGEPFRLASPELKERRLREAGVELLFVLTFDAALVRIPASVFATDILGGCLGLASIVAGADFRFGHNREGDIQSLREAGSASEYAVHEVAMAGSGGEVFSSSSIRAALRSGDPGEAARQLGAWHRIEGRVARGDGRGHDLGMATANIGLGDTCIPKFGVYAVLAEVLDGAHAGTYPGVASLGVNPTFGGNTPRLETHLLDFEGDLYGVNLSVQLCAWLRPEEMFRSAETLAEQMQRDGEAARDVHRSLTQPWER